MKNLVKAIGISLMVFWGLNNAVYAQVISFEETTHDFGTVSEANGDITHEFVFTNTGDKPLVIQRVNASCGCTTPGWTKEPVQPGAKGFVKATYGTKGRVYPFDKTLTVLSNATQPSVVLHIKGNVIAKPIDLKEDYPQTIGALRIKEVKDFSFPRMTASATSNSQILEVANAETAPVTIAFENVPDYIVAVAEPTTLQPQQKGVIRFTVDGKKRKTFGYVKDEVTVKVGTAKQKISVSSVVSPDVAKLTEDEKVKAPKVSVPSSTVKFESMPKGKDFVVTVELTNQGKSDLHVIGFSSNDASVAAVTKGFKVKGGKSAPFKITVKNPTAGDKNIKVYLNTNDPTNALLELSLVGKVE